MRLSVDINDALYQCNCLNEVFTFTLSTFLHLQCISMQLWVRDKGFGKGMLPVHTWHKIKRRLQHLLKLRFRYHQWNTGLFVHCLHCRQIFRLCQDGVPLLRTRQVLSSTERRLPFMHKRKNQPLQGFRVHLLRPWLRGQRKLHSVCAVRAWVLHCRDGANQLHVLPSRHVQRALQFQLVLNLPARHLLTPRFHVVLCLQYRPVRARPHLCVHSLLSGHVFCGVVRHFVQSLCSWPRVHCWLFLLHCLHHRDVLGLPLERVRFVLKWKLRPQRVERVHPLPSRLFLAQPRLH